MVAVTSTSIAMTFLKGVQIASTFSVASTWTDVTGMSISSVPNNSKIYFSFDFDKVTAGTMDARLTDGTNVFWSVTGITTAGSHELSLDGSVIQNSGGAATVKLQIQSSDANNAQAVHDSNGSCWFACTDADQPIVFAPTDEAAIFGAEPVLFPGKRQIGELKAFIGRTNNAAGSNFGVNVSGINIESPTLGTVMDQGGDLSAITSEIRMLVGEASPIWADSDGRGALIIGYNGYNVEITG